MMHGTTSLKKKVSLLLACAHIQVCVHRSLPITAVTATVYSIISGGNMYVMYVYYTGKC